MSLLSRPLRMGGLAGHADIVRISAQLTESPSIAGSFFTGRVASTGRNMTQPNEPLPADAGGTAAREASQSRNAASTVKLPVETNT